MATFKLQPPAFRPLPLGSISPTGWLQRQLRIQADGLSGHLDEFWPDVRDSQWFGGEAEAWERAPYWLDGVIPLAYVLGDQELIAKVTRYIDTIVEHQQADGWLGPRAMIAASGAAVQASYDLWGQILTTKVLLQAYEVAGIAGGDPAVREARRSALLRALRCIDRHIDRAPLFNWGQFRWFETLLSIAALYEETGEAWLVDLAAKLHAQGFDWPAFFNTPSGWPNAEPTPHGRWNYMSHVVNNAMAVKAPALWWRFAAAESDRTAPAAMIGQLLAHHGVATGMFTGDECLAGHQPTHGTELCAVVEYAFSLEVLLSVLGDPAFGDHLEQIIFNALPATFSPDMWSHQYDQQANQILCTVQERIWNTNGPASNTFGVEPNYGCCTANLSQGWPKFAAHLWMMTQDSTGLVAAAYAPSAARATLGGVPVVVSLETDYPFRDSLHLTVTTEAPATGSLWLRIPAWAKGAAIRLPDGTTVSPATGTFYEVNRTWEGTSELDLTLPMQPELRKGYRDAVAIQRGPLTYALKIGEQWQRINEDEPFRELPHADWEITPTSRWAYALAVDADTLADDVQFHEHPVGAVPFSPEGAPVSATVKGRELTEWDEEVGSAADVPLSPATSEEPLEELALIPYGCTDLRITEFPQLARDE